MSLNAAQCVIKKSYFLSRTTNDDVDGRRFQYRIFLQLIFTGRRRHSQFYFPLQKLPNPCLDSPFLYKHNLLSLKQPNFLALFLYFRLFNSEHVHYNFFADDRIRTADLWYRKKLLCQLNHNHWQKNNLGFPVNFSLNYNYDKSEQCQICFAIIS